MKPEIRDFILARCEDGQQEVYSKNRNNVFEWKLGKALSYGVTPNGFPFLVWQSKDFGSIQVGASRRIGIDPQSKLRNDTSASILLNRTEERMWTAEKMSREIVY